MSPLKNNELIMRSGERIEIYVADDGRSACPICGFLLNCNEWAWDLYWAGDAQGNKTGDPSVAASFNICPCCNTHYGVDDSVENPSVGSQAERWSLLRREWLERVPRSAEVIEQLRNIGITI
jgi:hypothetical protein